MATTDRQRRALELAEAAGADCILAAAPHTVTWLTGYARSPMMADFPFFGPVVALLDGDGATLVVTEDEAEDAAACGCELVTYEGFTIGDIAVGAELRRAVQTMVAGRAVATETDSLPAALAPERCVDLAPELLRARAVKDDDEIERLRAAIAVTDAGQGAAREAALAGATEFDVYAAAVRAMQVAADDVIDVRGDLVSGPRTAEIGGPPGPRALEPADLVLADLVPRVGGYWGDSCATFAVEQLDRDAETAFERVESALAAVVEAIRPGARAADIDRLGRELLDYPHHTGHGLGVQPHEEPRVVPGSAWVLEPGMVIAVEPGLYADGFGIRLEQVVLVTEEGGELLSGHSLGRRR
jgi:Xaa-Pro dipeptidase